MLDIIIRNGRIVDGSGSPAFSGDIAIESGEIRSVAHNPDATARLEIDAHGQVVAPGFIDPHTHFDAQIMWDGQARPALEHGVTTAVYGNCSLSLAPLKAEHRPKLVSMFQQIEEMPDAAFQGAFEWTWERFDDYVAALNGRVALNVAPLAGHSAIRMWVMGEDAQKRAAKRDEITAMQSLLRECLEAGAVGLSTSYVDMDENLFPVPSRFAHPDELDALSATLGEFGRMLQVVPEFYDTDISIARVDQLAELSLSHGIPTTFSPLFDSAATPKLASRTSAAERIRLRGLVENKSTAMVKLNEHRQNQIVVDHRALRFHKQPTSNRINRAASPEHDSKARLHTPQHHFHAPIERLRRPSLGINDRYFSGC